MIFDKFLIDITGLNDVVCNVIQNGQVCLWFENNAQISQFKVAVFKDGQDGNLDVVSGESAVSQTGPENRVHLCHIGTP